MWAIGAYLAQITMVVAGLGLRSAFQVGEWLLDDDHQAVLKGIVGIVLAILTWKYWDFIVFVVKYDWAHDRGMLLRFAVFAVKGVATVAGLITASIIVVAVAFSLCVAPAISIVSGLRALIRGVVVAWNAMRAQRVAQAAPDAPPDGSEVVLLQLSDLHIAAPKRQPFEIEVDPKHWPADMPKPTSERLRSRLQHILSAAMRIPQCPIVMTGDITDTGRQEEWDVVVETLKDHRERLVLSPGNHDISINRTAEPDFTCAKRRARQQRFRDAYAKLDPSLGEKSFEQMYPLRRPLPRGATLFVLDSNRYPSRYVLSNAVGLHGSEQLSRLAQLLHGHAGPIVVATHHHPVRHSEESFSVEDIYMIAIDGKRLLSILDEYQHRRPGNSVLLLHGHRHLWMVGRYKGILICGHPSSTLGQSSAGRLDGVGRYASVHLSADNEWYVTPHKVESALSDQEPMQSPMT